MRQVGADDDQRLVAAPDALQNLGDLFSARVADGQRQQRELVKHHLQEWQLHFQRMFLRMGLIVGDDLR